MRALSVWLVLLLAESALADANALRVPPGFEITHFADSDLANDIYCMAIGPDNNLIVSGRGYTRLLIDENKNGSADRAVSFADGPEEGAMGLLWEKPYLYFTADGGLRRYVDNNGDNRADGPSELIRKMGTGGEHDAHAIMRGPDGWMYVVCGNMTGIDKSLATTGQSPIKNPVAGCVVRFSPGFRHSEIVAHGFRNAYDMDFNSAGDLFTYDSDNERCVSLPWYEPTRFYHVRTGGHHGWLSPQRAKFWRMPPYFFDVVPPIATLGRGSPTGVVCYNHQTFPRKYRDGFFALDWTFGQVHFLKLQPEGDSYRAEKELFIETVGNAGFAPTDAIVHPETGDMYIAIGGRGTRGAVYRVRYKGTGTDSAQTEESSQGIPANPSDRNDLKLVQARMFQLGVGDIGDQRFSGTVWEGYSARDRDFATIVCPHILNVIEPLYPSTNQDLNRELTRLFAMLHSSNPERYAKVVAMLSAESDPVDDIHHLIVLVRMNVEPTPNQWGRIVTALLGLDEKLDRLNRTRDRHWPTRIEEIYSALAKKDEGLHEAMLGHPTFGRPEHALFASIPGFDRKGAAYRFLQRSREDNEFLWTPALIRLLMALPAEEVNETARGLWDQYGLRDTLISLLARQPAEVDRSRYLEAATSTNLNTLTNSLTALSKLSAKSDMDNIAPIIRLLRRLPDERAERRVRGKAVQLLEHLTGLKRPTVEAWAEWFAQEYPASSGSNEGVNLGDWKSRMAAIDWAGGNSAGGLKTYTRLGCASCHSGARALGPDLRGVAQRFSRDDLFISILQPSRDVPPRYQTILVVTEQGQTYQGSIIYEAVDSLILQTGPAETVRITNGEIAARRVSDQSLMPAGMLDKVSDQELADLYSYLQTLK